jgi:hypothetical protein
VSKDIPTITVNKDKNDVSVQIRILRIKNGYLVRGGHGSGEPVHYPTVEEAAEAVKQGLIKAFWEFDRR